MRCQPQAIPRLLEPALRLQQLEDAAQAARIAGDLFRVNAVGRLIEEIKYSLARQGDHARPDQYSVQINRRLPVNFGSSGVPLCIDALSLPGAADEVLQVRKDGPVRFAKEEIVEEDRLRNE